MRQSQAAPGLLPQPDPINGKVSEMKKGAEVILVPSRPLS